LNGEHLFRCDFGLPAFLNLCFLAIKHYLINIPITARFAEISVRTLDS
jgi:hypothetical protein